MTSREVAPAGLVGTLHVPSKVPAPGVLVLGGSEGGRPEWVAEQLAKRGFAAFALAYSQSRFDTPPADEARLPTEGANVPLEYCEAAINWMAAHHAVTDGRISVMGYSRGGELALQLGSMFNQVSAVVACVPSSIRWCAPFPPYDRPAWTYKGVALPYISDVNATDAQAAPARIEVERIDGPVLLISGGDDATWPSKQFADEVLDRLRSKGHAATYADQHLTYPKAGHMAAGPPWPWDVEQYRTAAGGTKADDLHAQRSSWRAMLSFMRQHTVRIGDIDQGRDIA